LRLQRRRARTASAHARRSDASGGPVLNRAVQDRADQAPRAVAQPRRRRVGHRRVRRLVQHQAVAHRNRWRAPAEYEAAYSAQTQPTQRLHPTTEASTNPGRFSCCCTGSGGACRSRPPGRRAGRGEIARWREEAWPVVKGWRRTWAPVDRAGEPGGSYGWSGARRIPHDLANPGFSRLLAAQRWSCPPLLLASRCCRDRSAWR
jgi:hypothetical protein